MAGSGATVLGTAGGSGEFWRTEMGSEDRDVRGLRKLDDFLRPLGWEHRSLDELSDAELLALIDAAVESVLWGNEIMIFGEIVLDWEARSGREYFPPGARRRSETTGEGA